MEVLGPWMARDGVRLTAAAVTQEVEPGASGLDPRCAHLRVMTAEAAMRVLIQVKSPGHDSLGL
jgi:hypothetical protein